MRRAAIPVPSNIAEGAASSSTREYAHFLSIARGSLNELDTQMEIACRLGLLSETHDVFRQLDRTFRLLNGLQSSIKKKLESWQRLYRSRAPNPGFLISTCRVPLPGWS
ncbi:four helix bundle protein [Zobellella sp. DQSA1]|uniref:four helix bundle protein n=1 Tax=Zobellella sp. DQSA1 TaxID=3342386 RepID=UPI0035BF1F72